MPRQLRWNEKQYQIYVLIEPSGNTVYYTYTQIFELLFTDKRFVM